MSKADGIRCFAEDIAQWRVDGLTWGQIAAKLGEEDICVSTDEIRSYWPRLSEGRSPAEYLIYWQSTQRNAELRVVREQLGAAEAEVETLQQELHEQMQSWSLWGRQGEALRVECDELREHVGQLQAQLAESQRVQSNFERLLNESRQQDQGATEQIRYLRREMEVVRERSCIAETQAIAHQRDATEADGRARAASAEVNSLRQQLSVLGHQLGEAEARIAKVVAENEVYGNIRYFMGMSEVQAQLDETNKTLNGWTRFGEALSQAHQARNQAEVVRLLDRVVAWAASRGKA